MRLSEIGDLYWLNRRRLIIQLLLILITGFVSIMILLPDAFGGAVKGLFPDPVDTLLEVVTIFLIASPIFDLWNKPRIRLRKVERQVEGSYEEFFRVDNIGNNSGEDAEVRLSFGVFGGPTFVLLEGGRLRPTPRRTGAGEGFMFSLTLKRLRDSRHRMAPRDKSRI